MNPNEEHRAAMLAQAAQVHTRFHAFTASAQAILTDQPSAGTVRAAARRLTDAITFMADEIAEGLPC